MPFFVYRGTLGIFSILVVEADGTTAATGAATASSSALADETSRLPIKLNAMKLVASTLEHFFAKPERSADALLDDIEISLLCRPTRDTEKDDVCAIFTRTSATTADFIPVIVSTDILFSKDDLIVGGSNCPKSLLKDCNSSNATNWKYGSGTHVNQRSQTRLSTHL